MYFENLAVEIYSTKAGLEPIKPARCRGASGVEHRFSFLASKEGRLYAFDILPEVSEMQVLSSYIKQMDTKAVVFLVCLKGSPSEGGARLAKDYGMKILSPADIGPFFKSDEWVASKAETPQIADTESSRTH